MHVETPAPVAAQARRRRAVKASSVPPVKKVKTTIHLSPGAAERLGIHALKAGMDRSEYLEELIQQHCRRWVVQDRSSRPEDLARVTEEVSAA